MASDDDGDIEMSLEKLLEKIEEEARREAEEILARAREETERIEREGKEAAEQRREEILRSYSERAERERSRILSQARMQSRMLLSQAKEEILNASVRKARELFLQWEEAEYGAWLKGLILANAGGGEELVPSSFDADLLEKGILDEVNRALKEKGLEPLTLSEERVPAERGVVLRRGGVAVNLTLDTLVRELRERHEEELIGILFGSDR
ncbi:MAG: V-type ATP synthase subunit E family protein [Candidatus Geothermincolales bacterium]